ncbi:uncharacterized protein EI90DRAFT_3043248 [Cantharellus anzutake]|uniref:uncharacterized protein n=1 Tax=Cantharellus anzutake TaxID=1750568 RepID=UPI0019044937|nr:uncharacterized protein EI90DRAFT_3043248 [Cantharellus anzutake]KAF8337519.1 hypothetical protein EI90DRAFT_3043248 [Cantharellus anzutake]
MTLSLSSLNNREGHKSVEVPSRACLSGFPRRGFSMEGSPITRSLVNLSTVGTCGGATHSVAHANKTSSRPWQYQYWISKRTRIKAPEPLELHISAQAHLLHVLHRRDQSRLHLMMSARGKSKQEPIPGQSPDVSACCAQFMCGKLYHGFGPYS